MRGKFVEIETKRNKNICDALFQTKPHQTINEELVKPVFCIVDTGSCVPNIFIELKSRRLNNIIEMISGVPMFCYPDPD